MVEDLIKLEGSILVNIPEPKVIKIGLLLYAADNLEAHQIGGYSGSFSSKSICRFCHCQYDDLDKNIHDHDGKRPHKRWSNQEYDNIALSLKQPETILTVENVIFPAEVEDSDEDDESDEGEEESDEDSDEDTEHIENWGVKSLCPLNVLQSFHCVSGLPPDVLHDHLEGVVPEDLYSIIRALSSKGWFSIDSYNRKLKDLGWFSYETRDKPQSVPTVRNTKKLKGKAVSQWVHIRNFPLLVEKFVLDKNDLVLALGLKLHEVTERILAPEFYEFEIQLLDDAVIDYLELRKKVRLEYPEFFARPKPKHHFLR